MLVWSSNARGVDVDLVAPCQAGHDGALAQDWLNWDREYGTWARAGMEVQTSIQFTAEAFPVSTWGDAYKAGYHYGREFGHHFGPTFGTGDVTTGQDRC